VRTRASPSRRPRPRSCPPVSFLEITARVSMTSTWQCAARPDQSWRRKLLWNSGFLTTAWPDMTKPLPRSYLCLFEGKNGRVLGELVKAHSMLDPAQQAAELHPNCISIEFATGWTVPGEEIASR